MKGNVHSSGCELKTRPWSHSGDSTSLNKEIDCMQRRASTYPAVTVWRLDEVSDFDCCSYFLMHFLPFVAPFSQSARETKAASHVLQTVWSYKELRNALTKDGWNKSHFQVLYRTVILWKLSSTCNPDPKHCYSNMRFLKIII